MKKVKLPSGAELEITLAPFADSRSLKKALARELKNIKIMGSMDISDPGLVKDVICSAISSDEITDAIDVCMKRCTYNGMRIDNDTFQPEKARQDYIPCCLAVTEENILPFVKGLLQQLEDILPKKMKSV